MVFGEINEPSTRALLYEEDDYVRTHNVTWRLKPSILPSVDCLLISETEFTNQIIETCYLNSGQNVVACTTCDSIRIYQSAEKKFIIKCNLKPCSSVGNITDEIRDWLDAAEQIFTLMTMPKVKYQSNRTSMNADMILRRLSTHEINMPIIAKWQYLEQPNLITGVGAQCLSYCVVADKRCNLFVAYIDYVPLDSINSQPFIELLNNIGFELKVKNFTFSKLPDDNLYM